MLMGDGSFRDRWVAEVFRTPVITDSTRVLLLALVPEMDEDGRVSVPRDDLAEALGRNPRKINERFKNAVEAGFLARVSRGQKHQNAVYQGVLSRPHGEPTETTLSGTHGGPAEERSARSQRAGFKHPEKSVSGTHGGPAEKNLSEPHGGPAEPAHNSKDHARAHSQRPPQPQTTHQTDSDHATGATVVHLFDDKNITTKNTHSARKRAAEPAPADDAFAAFWATYPRRVAKAAARKAFAKALKNGANPADIILGARRYATSPRRAADDIRYTAHPATWLNQERWTDEDEPAPQQAPGKPSVTDQRIAQAQALKALYPDNGHRPPTIRGEITR